jgi:UDP-glucuronate 4-epimerase
MAILVTGVAGFIGSHVAKRLLARGEAVVGIDNFSPYYSARLKRDRLEPLGRFPGFAFLEADICDRAAMLALPDRYGDLDRIVHLAAQPGVKQSTVDPYIYVQTNVMGHLVVLELARKLGATLKHMVYASSSSVYGGNSKVPFSVADPADHPVSFYAATKRADELMSWSYAHQYGVKSTALRFFTVYGPWGRPDMSPYIFVKAIEEGRTIPLYHMGAVRRDFAYIDDVVAGAIGILDRPPAGPMHRVYNLGATRSVELTYVLSLFEKALARKAIVEPVPGEPGDMRETAADISHTTRDFGWTPSTTIEQGIPRFVEWYKEYHRRA